MSFDINNEKILLNRNGTDVLCDVIFTFDCEDNMKNYVGYTDHSIGSNGRKNIFVSTYNPFSLKLELENITNKKELEMINNVLEQFDKKING